MHMQQHYASNKKTKELLLKMAIENRPTSLNQIKS